MEERNTELVFDFNAVFDVDDYLYFYSLSLTEERTEAEVVSLVKLLGLDEPKRILDLACGFGRHTNRLTAMGHDVTGIDLTPGFLEIARRDAQERGVQVDYRQGDMRQISFDNEFDCILILFTSFGYYDDEDNLRVLHNVARALKPGGVLLMDIPNRDAYFKHMLPYHVTERDENLMIDRMSFDSLSGRWYNRRVVIRDGVRKDKPFSIRLYNIHEIQALLQQAGLHLHKLYGGWNEQPISEDSRQLVIIARKRASNGEEE